YLSPRSRTRARRCHWAPRHGEGREARPRRQLGRLAGRVAARVPSRGGGARPRDDPRATRRPVDRHPAARRPARAGGAVGRSGPRLRCRPRGPDRPRPRGPRAAVPRALRRPRRRRRPLGRPRPGPPADGARRGGVRRARHRGLRAGGGGGRRGRLHPGGGGRRRRPGHRRRGRRPRRPRLRPLRHGPGVRHPAARGARRGPRRQPLQARAGRPGAAARGRQRAQGRRLPGARRRRGAGADPGDNDPMTDATTLPADNPFAAPSTLPFELPDFAAIRHEHLRPAMLAGLAAQRAEWEAIATDPASPDVANTLEALERSGRLLRRATAVLDALVSSRADDALRELEAELAPLRSAHWDALYLDRRIFARLEALTGADLDPETAWLLRTYRKDFVRAGVEPDDAKQARPRGLNR